MYVIERLGLLVRALALLGVLAVLAGAQPALAGPPQPAKGKGDKCVAPTDWMRRYHMTALTHKRDETVHEGIRTKKFSLKACIDCHAVNGDDGKPVTVSDPRHFCRTCHDYAAVSVDCFQCHASRPEPGKTAAGAVEPGAVARDGDVAALNRYLEGGAK